METSIFAMPVSRKIIKCCDIYHSLYDPMILTSLMASIVHFSFFIANSLL